jgi:hypothetical protein
MESHGNHVASESTPLATSWQKAHTLHIALLGAADISENWNHLAI